MVRAINLLKNVGKFDNVTAGSTLPFERITIIYAENGRGKTTLASIFRSLATGEPGHIVERQKLGTHGTPHIVVELAPGQNAVFQQSAWDRQHPNLLVFDDAFVAANICSGIEVEPYHRQNLHELIIGATGVALNQAVQDRSAEVEQCNRELREKANAIPAEQRGPLSVEEFCSLPAIPDLDDLISSARKQLAAATEAAQIATAEKFPQLHLPVIDHTAIASLLAQTLDDVDTAAMEGVSRHLELLGSEGESWVSLGVDLTNSTDDECPFCAQSLTHSSVIAHYRLFFSAAYKALQHSITEELSTFSNIHRDDVQTALEREVRFVAERRAFWAQFLELAQFDIDTAAMGLEWKSARSAILALLVAKRSAPLERLEIDSRTLAAIEKHNSNCRIVNDFNDALSRTNAQIDTVKEQARTANLDTIKAELTKLQITATRFEPIVAERCDDYLAAKLAKSSAETQRDIARANLESYRQTVFPSYATGINTFLQRFNANFRISNVAAVNIRGGSSANYVLEIDGLPVQLRGEPGEPAFRNTLSAGDRNTLALAFFFASIDAHPQKSSLTVVIDDPMTSLDEHRNLHTIHEIERLARETAGVIILSHSKPFLLGVWDKCRNTPRTAIEVRRDRQSSTLTSWNVNDAMICEHDRRYMRATDYLSNGDPEQQRVVAEAIRPMLENYIRVAYASNFKPGALLGTFMNTCSQRMGSQQQIMDQSSLSELRLLVDFGNRFHHDTNAGYATELINDAELVDFTRRTLKFMQR